MYQLGPKTSIALAMIGATSSIANFAFDASMINSLSIIPGYIECQYDSGEYFLSHFDERI
jgi:hypothetical protein